MLDLKLKIWMLVVVGQGVSFESMVRLLSIYIQ